MRLKLPRLSNRGLSSRGEANRGLTWLKLRLEMLRGKQLSLSLGLGDEIGIGNLLVLVGGRVSCGALKVLGHIVDVEVVIGVEDLMVLIPNDKVDGASHDRVSE